MNQRMGGWTKWVLILGPIIILLRLVWVPAWQQWHEIDAKIHSLNDQNTALASTIQLASEHPAIQLDELYDRWTSEVAPLINLNAESIQVAELLDVLQTAASMANFDIAETNILPSEHLSFEEFTKLRVRIRGSGIHNGAIQFINALHESIPGGTFSNIRLQRMNQERGLSLDGVFEVLVYRDAIKRENGNYVSAIHAKKTWSNPWTQAEQEIIASRLLAPEQPISPQDLEVLEERYQIEVILTGLIYDPPKSLAFLQSNGTTYLVGEGDWVGDEKVEEIHADGVLIVHKTGKAFLHILE